MPLQSLFRSVPSFCSWQQTYALVCSQRLDFTLDRLDERAEQQNAVLSQYRRQLKDARADIAAGNPYIEQIEALEQELERIDKELNESEAA